MGDKNSGKAEKAEPWGPQIPHLEKTFNQAELLYNSGGPDYYDKAGYVPFSSQSEMALGMAEKRALEGSPLNRTAQNVTQNAMSPGRITDRTNAGRTLQQTAKGEFLNSNPHLDDMYNAAASSVTENFRDVVAPGVNATFGAGGRTGSGLHKDAYMDAVGELGDSLGDMSADIYGTNYARERGHMMDASNEIIDTNADDRTRQFDAAQAAPDMANVDYNDIAKLAGVGATVEGKAGQILKDDMSRYNFYQNRPEKNLQNYINAINGNYGGVTNTNNNTTGLQKVGEGIDLIGGIASLF